MRVRRVPFSVAAWMFVGLALPALAAFSRPASTSATRPDYRLAPWPQTADAPDFNLVDVTGHTRTLADYRGRVVVILFGFVRCPDACPTELFSLALAMKRLGPVSEGVKVIFITLDPEHDTRQVLKNYVTGFDPRFIGLTGTSARVDQAAAHFHVEYARVAAGADYTIDHSTSTFVLDKQGRLRLVGTLSTSAADFAHDLALLATE